MLKKWGLTIIWALIILGLSIMPGISLPESWTDLFSMDKLAHFGVYAILSLLASRAYASENQVHWKNLLIIVLIGSIYGICIEFIQGSFFPGRFFEKLDIIANIIGSFTGVYIFNHFQRRKSRVT